MMQLKGGYYLLSTGFGKSILLLDKDYKLKHNIDGKSRRNKETYHFFAGAELQPNNNVIVTNWTGHDANDSNKGPQVIDFDEGGRKVWKWHDSERAGSLHGVVVNK